MTHTDSNRRKSLDSILTGGDSRQEN